MRRRSFLKYTAAAGATSFVFPHTLCAEGKFDDYKALVVLYQAGGNDSLNMFVPVSDDEKRGYAAYAAARDAIRVSNKPLTLPLSDGQVDLSAGNPYNVDGDLKSAYLKGVYRHRGFDIATNGLMPEIAHLIDSGEMAVVLNAGNLIMPSSKEELSSKKRPKPPFLFAHNHQTKLMMNGEAALLDYTGWAGRLFDTWRGVNGDAIYGMNIGIGRNAHLFYGNETTPLIIKPSGPTAYKKIERTIYDNRASLSDTNHFSALYRRLQKHSFAVEERLVDDWNNLSPTFSGTNAYGGSLFEAPSNTLLQQEKTTLADTSLLRDLSAVARLAYIGKQIGLKRQIFFVQDGGYDTHSNQIEQHARKLRGLSLGVGDFTKALKELGMFDEVTLLSVSDFGRSTGSNGDGTDHAWGGSYFVTGGAVRGGQYGDMPDLTLGSEDDLTKKGRLIPTVSMSQYYATVLKWFGVDREMRALLPELENFERKDLGFMKA